MSNNRTSEEIDLAQLFKLIGNVFNTFFLFIGKIFNSIFHLFISFLQFIRVHFLKFVLSVIVGIAIGWYLDSYSEPIYRSSMIVEPNFNSTQQLYNNIRFYNDLAREQAFQALAESLKISDNEAETVKSIEIESFTDENQKIKQFSNFILSLDSTSRNLVQYEDYLNNFNNINAKFHRIKIESIDPKVAKKTQKAIVQSIENNDYFRIQKNTNALNLKINDSIVRKQLAEVDSLKVFYQNLKMLEVQKSEKTSGTNINLSSENQNLDRSEIALLSEAKSLSNEILILNQRKVDTENIVNIISDFPSKGALVSDFFSKKKVLYPIYLLTLTFVMLIILSLNRYLKNYKQ